MEPSIPNNNIEEDIVQNTAENTSETEKKCLPCHGCTPYLKRDVSKEERATSASHQFLRLVRFAGVTNDILCLLGVIFSLGNGVFSPIFSIIFGDIVSTISNQKSVNKEVIIIAYLSLASFVISTISAALLETVSVRISRNMRIAYFKSAISQDIAWHDAHDSGYIQGLIEEAVVKLRVATGIKLGQLSIFVSMTISGFSIAFYRDWRLALVCTACLPILTIAVSFASVTVANTSKKFQEAYANCGSIADEAIRNIRTVASYNLMQKFIDKYTKNLKFALRKDLKASVILCVATSLLVTSIFFLYSVGFWYGGQLAIQSLEDMLSGKITSPSFDAGRGISVFFTIMIAAFALGRVGPLFQDQIYAYAALEKVFEVIDRQPKIKCTDQKETKNLEDGITFKNVSFSYPSRPDMPVFQNLNVKLPFGETVAIVGASGCGKSTIVKLLLRFYEPTEGSISWDDVDYSDINIKSLRTHIGVVNQEPLLFSGSISKNIRYGKMDASTENIVNASKDANVYDFCMSFANRFSTFVGAGGNLLSGGQKQRVAIARAIIRNPQLLILDEATSSLDCKAEEEVQNTLDRLMTLKNRLTVVIAHRLSTVKKADRIIVLSPSKDQSGAYISEIGTHVELLGKKGVYYSLVNSQIFADDEKDTNVETKKASDDINHQIEETTAMRNARSYILSDGGGDVLSSKTLKDRIRNYFFKKIKPSKKKDFVPTVSLWTIFCMVKSDIHWIITGVLSAMINGLSSTAFALIFTEFLGTYALTSSSQIRYDTKILALYFTALAVIVFVTSVLEHTTIELAGVRLVGRLRVSVLSSILNQDMAFFDNPEHSVGYLGNTLAADTILVKGAVASNLGVVAKAISSLVSGIVIAFLADARLALVVISTFFVLIPAGLVQSAFFFDERQKTTCSNDGGYISEALNNIRVIHSLNLEDTLMEKYEEDIFYNSLLMYLKSFGFGLLWGFSQGGNLAVNALALWYAGIAQSERGVAPKDIFRAIFSLLFAAMGMGQAAMYATDTKIAKEAAAKVLHLMNRIPQIDSRSSEGENIPKDLKAVDVSFENLKFRYPQRIDTPVYKDVTFDIPKGSFVAIVGESGCGKSTIMQLLERFYEYNSDDTKLELHAHTKDSEDMTPSTPSPTSGGSITMEGIELNELNTSNVRENIGLVGQEPVLFHGSIEENILNGDENATKDDMIAAAKSAGAHDFIMQFPDGYSTSVGSGGNEMSGGQKQRIAIARALIRKPKLLLLDEATSALDATSEKIVQESIDILTKSKDQTIVVIAHKLSSVRSADKIIVLSKDLNGEGSKVVEVGTHEELMKITNGVYSSMVKASS